MQFVFEFEPAINKIGCEILIDGLSVAAIAQPLVVMNAEHKMADGLCCRMKANIPIETDSFSAAPVSTGSDQAK